MPSFVESIHPLHPTQSQDCQPPHGPLKVDQTLLLASSYDGRLFQATGLPGGVALAPFGHPVGENDALHLPSFRLNAAGTHATAQCWSGASRAFDQYLLCVKTGMWQRLAVPDPTAANVPKASAVLGFWVNNDVVVFTLQPRLGRLHPETLFWSRYDLQGRKIATSRVMMASERGHRLHTDRDAFWSVDAGERVFAHAWNRFFAFSQDGVCELPAPGNVDHVRHFLPSDVLKGRTLLFSHDDMEDEAILHDIDLASWTSIRHDVSPLLRGPRGASLRWMPDQVEIVHLRDDWCILNLHDGDPLNRTAFWLWDRSVHRAWAVPMKEVGGRFTLSCAYLAACDRFISSDHDTVIVSRPLDQIMSDLRAAPRAAKVLSPPRG